MVLLALMVAALVASGCGTRSDSYLTQSDSFKQSDSDACPMSMPHLKCGISKLPAVGLGTWQSKPGEVGRAVEHALTNGYRHVDCAAVYGNEPEIGSALSKVFASGAVKREDVFITSKLWNTRHRAEEVPAAFQKTLNDLQLDYLDLYLVHWPVSTEPGRGNHPVDENKRVMFDSRAPSFAETWSAMEELVADGKCKNIGLSNFNIKQMEEILGFAKVGPACLQVESHPLFPNTELLDFCKQNNIAFVAYSPLVNPGSRHTREKPLDLFMDEDVQKIAGKHGVTISQVLIRYQVERGGSVIPKSITPARIEQNIDVLGFKLDEEDMSILNNIYKKAGPEGYRTITVPQYKHHSLFPF